MEAITNALTMEDDGEVTVIDGQEGIAGGEARQMVEEQDI